MKQSQFKKEYAAVVSHW